MKSTDAAWETWGQTDPYFAVVSHPQFRTGTLPHHREEFFAGGREIVARRIAEYEQVFGPLPRSTALDFGCGVGRLTLPLAEQFVGVTGLDISEAMLVEARRNAMDQGLSNVQFERSDDTLSAARGTYAFVHTYIVLQHIPTRRGMMIISELLDRVQPDGGFFLHVSVHTRGLAWRGLYWAVHHIPGLYKVNSLLKRRPMSDPAMQMNGYSAQQILASLAQRGIDSVHVTSELHNDVLTLGFLGRNSGSLGRTSDAS